jgi:vancomycin resistance protein YoaR
LYAAALLAGLRIEKRWAHTWTSSYIAPGFDATVSYPQKDLVVRNPYSFAVRISVVPREDGITIQLWGEQARPGWVEISTTAVRHKAFETRRELDPTLGRGEERLALKGLIGMRIVRTRRFFTPHKRPRLQNFEADFYYPRNEVWAVGSLEPMLPKTRIF